MSGRSVRVMPGTGLARWSVGLIVVMPILFVIGLSSSSSLYESVTAGHTLLADIAVRPLVTIPMLAGMTAGVASFITGLLAIIKQKDKAILVFVSTTIGGIVLFFLVSLLVFPE